jgi:hypothetical protein
MFAAFHARRHLRLVLALMILLVSQAACGPLAAPPATPTSLPSATTAPTDTPVPTSTSTPTPTPTLTPSVTPNYLATQYAKQTATVDAKIASIAPVLADLDLSTDTGRLVWYAKDPIFLMVDDYNSFVYAPVGDEIIANFVLHAEATWDSTSGLAGCGVILRSDGNIDTGKYYQFELMRLQNAPAWEMYYVKYHWIEKYLTRYKFDSVINDGKNSVNTIDLVVQNNQFTPYINGEKKITMENNDIAEGLIYVLVHQESGTTSCSFDNIWVWSLD